MSPLRLSMEELQAGRIIGYRMQVVATAYSNYEDKPVFITPECVTLTQFEREVTRIQDDLKNILDQARAKVEHMGQNKLL